MAYTSYCEPINPDNFCTNNISETDEEKKIYCRISQELGMKEIRVNKIREEIRVAEDMKDIIKYTIVKNLGLNKGTRKSHIQNARNKITGINTYNKPIYFIELNRLRNNHKTKIKKIVYDTLGHEIIEFSKQKNEIEMYFTYFIICKIYNRIDMHINHLNGCIDHINKDEFHLSKKHHKNFNDVLQKVIIDDEPQNEKIFFVEYRIHDYNTLAINNATKCKSNASVLALDKKEFKWHLYPDIIHDDKNVYSSKTLMEIVDNYKHFEFDYLDDELTHMLKT